MLSRRIESQKKIQKILVDLLYKKSYCVCIPDFKLVESYLEQVSPAWIQKFLLSKNGLNLTVIPMFMLIFVKNKYLTVDQSQRLFKLLHLLMMRAESDTIDQLFFNNKKQENWPYYILNELVKFTRVDFDRSEETRQRIMAMASAVELILGKASLSILSKFCLNIENSGFNVIQKLLHAIAYQDLQVAQIIYLSSMSQKIISQTTGFGIEALSFQVHCNGYSFIWCVLETWLHLVFECDNSSPIKINYYTKVIDHLFEKIENEKMSFILLENKNKGYSIILRYIFFSHVKLSFFHPDLIEASKHFNAWCEKFFSPLTFKQIELMLKTLLSTLNNDTTLFIVEKRQLLEVFFDYLLDYSQLKTKEIKALKDSKERLEAALFPSTHNAITRFFRQVRARWYFFNDPDSWNSINEADQVSFDENSDLLIPKARLNTNYLAVNT